MLNMLSVFLQNLKKSSIFKNVYKITVLYLRENCNSFRYSYIIIPNMCILFFSIVILNIAFQTSSSIVPFPNHKSLFLDKQFLMKLILKHIMPSKTIPKLPKIIFPSSASKEFERGKNNEDMNLNMTQLIIKNGFPVETHEVLTIDGYILKMFRIPGTRPAVLLMHGLMSSSNDWVTNGENRSLAYMLAERGFDVWFGNVRGNFHSRRHVTLTLDQRYQFWNFSWDEIGRYDLSSMIDYVLDVTGSQTLIYVCHSQGCTSFFVLCSELPEYNKKISYTVAMSTPVFMAHTKSASLQLLSQMAYNQDAPIVKLLGPEFSANDLQAALKSRICNDATDIVSQQICLSAVFIVLGVNYKQVNYERLPIIAKNFVSGSSIYQLVHYAQSINTGEFRQVDRGQENNLISYGTADPPDYPLEKVTVKMAIFHGEGDWLNHINDVTKLLYRLKNVNYTFHQVPHKFAHLDFLFAKDVKTLLYVKVLRLIESQLN